MLMLTAVDSYPPTALARSERNRLWGYPHIYRQLTEDVLPAMQAADELRSRHAQQQAVDSDSSQLQVEVEVVGLGPPPGITPSPPTDTPTVGGQVGVAVGIRVGIDVQAPLASGSVAEDNRSDGMNLASESLDMPVAKEPLYPGADAAK